MALQSEEERKQNRKQLDLSLTEMRRNPYLEEYGRNRRSARPATRRMPRPEAETRAVPGAARRTSPPRRKSRSGWKLTLAGCLGLFLMVVLVAAGRKVFDKNQKGAEQVAAPNMSFFKKQEKIQGLPEDVFNEHPDWTEDYLTINEYSRPGEELQQVKNIFVHYTANIGTSASQNRSYFEQLKDTGERSASAHFIIGYEGEIIQCIPLNEIAYAVQTRNYDSVSIECCYLAEDGSFTQETYDSLLAMLRWLTKAYQLDAEDVLRHYDCGGKKCPLYYVEHSEEWEKLKAKL
ncbi:MAG: peptidoglycan recognition protein family protein [Roseburia sp.]|nr:peptidoglycan recognition protein family protein [Roseburia sp.]